jgi:hypothetical protein
MYTLFSFVSFVTTLIDTKKCRFDLKQDKKIMSNFKMLSNEMSNLNKVLKVAVNTVNVNIITLTA